MRAWKTFGTTVSVGRTIGGAAESSPQEPKTRKGRRKVVLAYHVIHPEIITEMTKKTMIRRRAAT